MLRPKYSNTSACVSISTFLTPPMEITVTSPDVEIEVVIPSTLPTVDSISAINSASVIPSVTEIIFDWVLVPVVSTTNALAVPLLSVIRIQSPSTNSEASPVTLSDASSDTILCHVSCVPPASPSRSPSRRVPARSVMLVLRSSVKRTFSS